ncbi:nuclear transport factor 2 family protein [Undibacterium sp. TS12]|uniref:nuclear transport factor 2 family protein n=1 Tax=Undibacterium sp. TS12 TaxID=2908202 RepID=UPI001F4CFFEA|nr:nuclear transport factor 2 family protein [Undibacterium sp. TS12]MCH8618525.1 nuclear transport factor 2 family protein [Undibacterium sp. TS12]
MYAYIVERKLRKVFAAISEGNALPMLNSLAATFVYRFEGDSPISGLRNSQTSMALWWQRLYRLFPGLRFVVREVAVQGPPWNTRIHVMMDFIVPHEPDGPYRNIVMQFMRMQWGKISYIHTLEDTQRCARYLAWSASQGCEEALAGPITDKLWPEAGPFLHG